MNKNAVKEYAIWARRELIDRVSQKAFEYGIEKDNIESVNGDVVKGIVLTNEQKAQRETLVTTINTKGFDQVMEEVAYTWFNRFIALRFMEVNNYLPQKVRPFTDEENKFNPQLITDALELDFVDKDTIYSYKDKNDTDGLYKYLLISLCNDMNQYLPGMFTKIDNYTTLLFPDNLLRDGSVVSRLISDIDEDSWNDQVQIIGWLYQYYISERHDKVVSINGSAITKENIPAATQIFTTDWVVRYMVDNSLGRYWIERNPEAEIINNLKFYLKAKDGKINSVNERITPEELTFIDPCMGSGHILVYAFDVLMQIYESQGYTQRDAASLILKNNIYGLDIDERAYQLSYFALMMKARQYSRRIFNEHIDLNVMDIKESNGINYQTLDKFKELKPLATKLVDLFKDAKEYGSILIVDFTSQQLDQLENRLEEIYSSIGDGGLFDTQDTEDLYTLMKSLIKQARILTSKYKVVTTNPPYMNKFSNNLKNYTNNKYADYKSDLFSVFMYRNFNMTSEGGYLGFMTPNVWMFIKSYDKLRKYIIFNKSISSLIQLAKGAFFEEATVDIATFVLKNSKSNDAGLYIRLEDFKGGMDVQKKKVLEAIANPSLKYYFETEASNFSKIPGSPIAYWISETIQSAFLGKLLGDYGYPKQGFATGNNDLFLRLWHEVDSNKIGFGISNKERAIKSCKKWFPCNKGGQFQRWYGNNNYVVNWENDGFDIKGFKGSVIRNPQFYFQKGTTWSSLGSGGLSMRYSPVGHLFESKGSVIFPKDENNLNYILGFCNSKVIDTMLSFLSPTLDYHEGPMSKVPLLISSPNKGVIDTLVEQNIILVKTDWDSFETSWDFAVNPLIKQLNSLWDATAIGATIHKYYGKHIEVNSNMELCYHLWKIECNERFKQLKENEEELNRIFIDIYGLQDELTPEESDKDVTVHYVVDRKEDIPESFKGSNYVRTKQDEIKSFISYAVGCMFGRYSLDTKGLVYAGGECDSSKYSTFIPDKDNIIPISDDEFFEDDVTGRFINFVETVYGKDTLEENLQFIADALGGKGTSRQVIRNYFVNQFFIDHCNTYQVTGSGKRPIYWLFDSGKKNGFKALIYMHRYTPDLLAKMRTDYVHEQQERYRTQIENLESEVLHLSGSEKIKAEKTLTKYKDQLAETSKFEEKLHHLADQMISIDLDDGFKQNYPKFEDVVAKVK